MELISLQEPKIDQNITFNEFRSNVIMYVQSNFMPNTLRIYKNTLSSFGKFIGEKEICQISIFDLENYKSYRLKTVSRSTCNIDIRTLKASFNLAKNWGMIEVNPAEKVKQFRIVEKEILCFSKEEIELIIDTIDDDEILKIVKFALNTGLRISELINLQIRDFNRREKIIEIRNKYEFKTKSKRNRKIPLNQTALDIAENCPGNPDDYMFKNSCKRKFSKDHLTRMFKKYLRKAELPEKFHFHCLRHTFITELIKKGVNINYVKELAGHSDIKTTMNYIHIVTDDLRDAVDLICS